MPRISQCFGWTHIVKMLDYNSVLLICKVCNESANRHKDEEEEG